MVVVFVMQWKPGLKTGHRTHLQIHFVFNTSQAWLSYELNNVLQHIGCCMATTMTLSFAFTILHTAFQAFHWGGGEGWRGGGEGLLAHISGNKVRIT